VDTAVKPYYDHAGITIFHGDCREVLPGLVADVVFADPPYGVNKAGWDATAPTEWLELAAAATVSAMAVTPGISNLLDMPREVAHLRYRWTMSVRIVNALVRGAMGFGNWIACLVYAPDGASVYSCAQDATQIAIRGTMPNHPSPKPFDAMRWILSRLPAGSVLDPFMGSGTTLRAAKDLGRRAIGIEIEERYCEIAARRLSQEVLPFAVEET
jgi:site-specific DNA-methyltransferase (adenine-specific)